METGNKQVQVIMHFLPNRMPILALTMEITTSNGGLLILMETGSTWNKVKQRMSFMLQALQVQFVTVLSILT